MVNLGNMMKQAQQLQKKMAEAQNKLNDIEVEGTSGGGLIKVTATAKGNFKRISIDDSLIKQEEKEILEDLIVAAINDAKEKGEAAAQEEMKNLTGGLPLPPGMKLPF
ncbi:YbaB/EbfC family nucleoid-associated protein [Pelagibacteraceae bacterium]|nr:YbaB/EbfC family nucleoid-associated protein [Pelagibacteraceae bacterium]